MKLSFYIVNRVCAGAVMLIAGTAAVAAATLNVPSGAHSNLYSAIAAAGNGDEIRVANDYTETLAWATIDNKAITIRSYTPDFVTPAAGAKWETNVFGGVDDALITLNSGSLTIDGFYLSTPDGNAVFMNSGSTLVMNDCETSGISLSNTAGIKAPAAAQNLSITITGSKFNNNGRAIWLNGIGGNSALTISDSEFIMNTSYPIEWRLAGGTHDFDVTNTKFVITNNRQVRTLAYDTAAGQQLTAHASFDQCYFEDAATGRSPIKVGGVPDAADPGSTMTLAVTNCVFDLTGGLDNVETVALDTQDDTSTRRFAADFTHCTIAFGGASQCGFRLRENQSVINVRNCIVDGNGEGLAALRAWRGTINSRVNLLNATQATATATGGSVQLSGEEIIGESAEFVNRTGGELSLTMDSPAKNVGEDLGITSDILGNLRPNPSGSKPDLGAYEVITAAAVQDWAVY